MKPAKEEFPAEVLAASPKQKEFASALRSPHRFLGIWVVIVASRVSFAPALAANGHCVAGDVLDLRRVGVPQRWRRFVMFSTKVARNDPTAVLTVVVSGKTEPWNGKP